MGGLSQIQVIDDIIIYPALIRIEGVVFGGGKPLLAGGFNAFNLASRSLVDSGSGIPVFRAY
jgi:hypothetical protein